MGRKKILVFLALMLIVPLAVGCAQPVAATEAKSKKARQTEPAIGADEIAALADANSSFAINLYRTIVRDGENTFFSPYSISEALAMTYGGARGETERQMAAALNFQMPPAKLHAAFNGIDIELARRGEKAQKGQDEKGFRLNVVNAIWGQQGFKFREEYLDLLALNYGAGMRLVDYIKDPEKSRRIINQWVSDQTEGKIVDLLPDSAVNTFTRLILTNAVYFNAAWASPFREELTRQGKFHLLEGGEADVPMMFQMGSFRYAEGAGYQAVELPYDGHELAMIILLPAADLFQLFEERLAWDEIEAIIASLQTQTVNLTMPKFRIESDFNLKTALSSLGMPLAFSAGEADFSGIDGRRDLYISDVIHKAYVSVDEAGTEAAAATGVVVGTTSMPVNVKDVTLDHPFIFLIRDNPTGSILFMGRVMHP